MIDILFLTIKILFILFFVGYGFTAILIPEKLRKDAFWLIPWFGVILITILSVSLNLARIPIREGKYIIILFALFMFFYSVLTRKKLIFFSKELLMLGLLSLICFLINIYPLLTKAGFPTSISFGNLDIITYSNVGDYLINHTVTDMKVLQPFKPYSWSVMDFLFHSFRWGSPLILSFFSSVFGLKAYQVFTIMINLFFSLSFPLVYILTKILYPKNKYLLLVLIFITYALNATILYLLYHVFFGQFIFTGLYLLITILVYSYLEEIKRINFVPNVYEFLIALAIAAVTTIYAEGLLFILTPIAGFAFFSLIFSKKSFLHLLTFLKIFIISIIISPITFGLSIKQNINKFISTIGVTSIGWEKIRNANPAEMIGLYNLNYSQELTFIIALLVGLVISAVWILGISQIKKRLLFLMNIFMALSFFIMYRYVFPNFFTYHRAATYTIFFFIILFSIGIGHIFSLFKNKIVKILVVLAIFILVLRSFYRTFNLFHSHCQIVDQSLISLSKLNKNNKIKKPFFTSDVYLGEYNLWRRLWVEYFLQNKSFISRQNYVFNINNLKEIKLVLSEKNYLEREGKKIIYKKTVWENNYYKLGEIESLKVWPIP
jgi:hypothetical protein